MNIKTNIKFKRVEAGIYQWQGQIKVNEEAGQVARDIVVTVERNQNAPTGAGDAWGVTEELQEWDGETLSMGRVRTCWDWITYREAKEYATRRYTEWATVGRAPLD